VTKYDWFRRRIAPIAFGLAIALMARESCHNGEQGRATFVIDLGAAKRDVRAIDAELWMGGEQLAVLHRAAIADGSIGDVQFEARLEGHDGEVRIDVERADKFDHVVRHFHADDGATVTVMVGNALN
jgi:hypothetical protein